MHYSAGFLCPLLVSCTLYWGTLYQCVYVVSMFAFLSTLYCQLSLDCRKEVTHRLNNDCMVSFLSVTKLYSSSFHVIVATRSYPVFSNEIRPLQYSETYLEQELLRNIINYHNKCQNELRINQLVITFSSSLDLFLFLPSVFTFYNSVFSLISKI